MELISAPSRLAGRVRIPGSKSHTIRAVAFAAMAGGRSTIIAPLESFDTQAAVRAYEALGATITRQDGSDNEPPRWIIDGYNNEPSLPDNVIDVGNSGTTLRIAAGTASLSGKEQCVTVFTGDKQIRRRPIGPLLHALAQLGAHTQSTRNNGCAPVIIGGRLRGGQATLEAVTSQYVTSILMCTPCADGDTELTLSLLNEQPYVAITCDWLDRLGIRYEHDDWMRYRIPGGQSYGAFERAIPADFSSATFFLCAAAIAEGQIVIEGLDMSDRQGDKAVIDYLRAMGAQIEQRDDGVHVGGSGLQGTEIDMNATPDALPAMAVTACFAEGTTRLVHVAQARVKECDRIAAMTTELNALGGRVRELEDGLVIEYSPLVGGRCHGHDDHRIVMAAAVAGLASREPVIVDTAEAAGVTFPTFVELMQSLGADVRVA